MSDIVLNFSISSELNLEQISDFLIHFFSYCFFISLISSAIFLNSTEVFKDKPTQIYMQRYGYHPNSFVYDNPIEFWNSRISYNYKFQSISLSKIKSKHGIINSLFQCQYYIGKRKSIYCMMKSTCAEPRKECVRARLVMYHPFLCTRFRVPVHVRKK